MLHQNFYAVIFASLGIFQGEWSQNFTPRKHIYNRISFENLENRDVFFTFVNTYLIYTYIILINVLKMGL